MATTRVAEAEVICDHAGGASCACAAAPPDGEGAAADDSDGGGGEGGGQSGGQGGGQGGRQEEERRRIDAMARLHVVEILEAVHTKKGEKVGPVNNSERLFCRRPTTRYGSPHHTPLFISAARIFSKKTFYRKG